MTKPDEPRLGAPLKDAEFTELMARLGPFEASPHLAVAVSGGSDSMALALLAHRWCSVRGGAVLALTVDHGLRRGSDVEAAEAGRVLARAGIAQRILRWEGDKPASGIQEAARTARYRLLERACVEAGVLHLLLAHQQDDQAETLLLRLGHGSGPFGLAGMSAIREGRAVRLLRPLLTIPRARLRATLRAAGLGWLDDPSNRNPAFARTAVRERLERPGADGPTVSALAASSRRLGRARASAEIALADLLASAVRLRPEGFAEIDGAAFSAASWDARLRLLAAVTATVGGGEWPPRGARVERFEARMRADGFGRHTLGGCLVRATRTGFLVCREPEAPATLVVAAGTRVHWDGRFDVTVPADAGEGLTLGPLGAGTGGFRGVRLPADVRAGLPALHGAHGIVAVARPGGMAAPERESVDPPAFPRLPAIFRPRRPLLAPGFALV